MSAPSQAAPTSVTVRAIAAGGSGVADLPDGRVVFVPRTVPGDVAEVRLTKEKSRWARASLERLVERGPTRREAPCSLYDRCGGCQLQHLPYSNQLEWKGRFIADAFRRIGGFDDVEPPVVTESRSRTRYRTRVAFTLRRLPGGRVVAGFHGLDAPAHVVDVGGQCLLLAPDLTEAWLSLRSAWGGEARHLPAGGRLRLSLRLAEGGVELTVEGGRGGWNASALLERASGLSAVWHQPKEASLPVLIAGRATEGGGIHFEQVNRRAGDELREYVVRAVGSPHGLGTVVDAYCGGGAFATALALNGWSTVGIDVLPGSVDEADRPDVDLTLRTGRVEEELAGSLPAEVVIVNPPRRGLTDEVVQTLLADPPSELVYVSCDPATLARDGKALAERFDLTSLAAFDLFPQTAHVECVSVWTRRSESSS